MEFQIMISTVEMLEIYFLIALTTERNLLAVVHAFIDVNFK
jgi:hypothetical protein